MYRPFRQIQNIKRQALNYDLVDHVWIPGYFTDAEVDKVRSLWDDNLIIDAKVNKGADTGHLIDDLRKSRIMFIESHGGNEWIYDKLATAILQVNTNRFKFDIKGFHSQLQFANYGPGDFFEWHLDYGAGDISDRKLSISVQLSSPEEYEGGELQFMINHKVIDAPKTKGTAIIFPSYAMHRVLPTTSGSRKSIVGWIEGTPFR